MNMKKDYRESVRYLFAIGSLKFGGAERSVSRLSNHLAGEGHEVHLLLRKNIINYELSPDVKVHFLDNWREGGTVSRLFKFRRRLRQAILRIDPDVSVAYTSLYGVLLASTMIRPVAVRLDVYPLTLRPWKRLLFLSFYNLPNVRTIVCLTRDTKEDLSRFFPSHKLRVVHNAALPGGDLREKAALAEDGVTSREYLVGLGRLAGTKGFDKSLRAYAKAEAYRHCDFVIIGDGVEMHNLKALSEELDIEEYVHFVGFRENPFPIVAGALCLVHASQREGFPNVFTEALSLGVPVIAMNCKTGPSEIIEPGINGYLVGVGDIDGMARKMNLILEDRSILTELRNNAEASVERFSEERVFRRWKEVLGELVSYKRASRHGD